MARYLITWAIDYDDDGTPEEAARWALNRITHPGSIAHVFDVIEPSGVKHHIDLDQPEESYVDLTAVARPTAMKSTISGICDVLRNVQEASGADR